MDDNDKQSSASKSRTNVKPPAHIDAKIESERKRTLLTHLRVIDGTGSDLQDQWLLIGKDGRIERIGSMSDVPTFDKGADDSEKPTRIDMKHKTILPGLIDAHVHTMLNSRDMDPLKGGVDAHAATINGVHAAAQLLAGGVTTARDLGGIDYGDVALKRAIAAGEIPGPRLLVSGKVLTMTGGHGWSVGREVDSPDEARKAARDNFKHGADNLKMMATGGILTQGVHPWSPSLNESELKAGFDEARKAGKISACHAQGTEGVINAVRAGVRTIEHGFWLNEEACALMAEKNVYFCATLSAPRAIFDVTHSHEVAQTIPNTIRRKIAEVIEYHQRSFRLAHKMGVKLINGTDAGTPLNDHGDVYKELVFMNELGLTPMECIIASTKTAAEALFLENDLGTLEPGKLADFVVTDEDPLENLSVLKDPAGVYKGGREVDLESLRRFRGDRESIDPTQLLLAARVVAKRQCSCGMI